MLGCFEVKNKKFVLGLCLGLATLPGWAQTVWKLATGYPETNFHVQNIQKLSEDLGARTGGQLKISVHAGGSLIPAHAVRQAVKDGTVAVGEVFGPSLSDLHPVFSLDVMPFLATSYEDARRLWKLARPLAERKLKEQGLVLLMSVPWPPQCLFSRQEIRQSEDFVGLTMRENSPPVKLVAERLGAKPVHVETPDLAVALRSKKIDLIFTSVAQAMDFKLSDGLPWFYQANAWLPRNVVVVNKKMLDGLPQGQRDAVIRAAAAAEERGWEMSESSAHEILAQIKARPGVKSGVLSSATRNWLLYIGGEMGANAMRSTDPDMQAIMSTYLRGQGSKGAF